MNPITGTRPKRSAVLIILSGITLVISLLGWLRLLVAIGGWDYLGAIAPAVLPIYLAISGMIWALIGLVSAVGIWLRRRWALILLGCAVISFTIWYWMDRLLLSANPDANSNWIFSLVLTAGILIYFADSILAVWEETV
jgi:hypothetical protein